VAVAAAAAAAGHYSLRALFGNHYKSDLLTKLRHTICNHLGTGVYGSYSFFVQCSSTIRIVAEDTVPYALRMNRIYSVCITHRRQGSHGVLALMLMLATKKTTTTIMMLMNFITGRKIMVLILLVKTAMPKQC
jgi:hypothetical protein